jgi:nucleotide-binding universal stress UspA family protein
MNIKSILLPTDFSSHNTAALHYASKLASESGALLFIAHVDESDDLSAALGEAGYLYADSFGSEDHHEVREQLTAIKPTVAGVACEHRYLRGFPVKEILNFAERESIDLIVMASHGRTGLARLLMGSIAEGVMRGAHCPVLVVKQPAAAIKQASDYSDSIAHRAMEPWSV